MRDLVNINGKKIGSTEDVFIIAELGINHNGNFETAQRLVDEAKGAGVSAVKLQTYITEKRVAKDSPIFDNLKKCELSFEQQKQLFKQACDLGMEIFSTPFDDESVEFLESLNAPCYKIASFDLVNKKLLRKVAEQEKPVIMSRGMANKDEIDTAVSIMQEYNADIILLHCISAYPASLDSLNLHTIQALREQYQCPVGFSDHSIGTEAPPYAVAAGACVIEKHFTLSRSQNGGDHSLSLEPADMKEMITEIVKVNQMMGSSVWSFVEEEKEILQYRRSA